MSIKAIFVTWEPKAALDGMMQLDPWEELAYRRILDMIYVSGNKLEDNDKKLAWSTKTGNRWKSIRKTLFGGDEPKLYSEHGCVRNKKCNEKLKIIDEKIEQKSKAGKASAEKRKALKKKETTSMGVDAPLNENSPKTSIDGQLTHLTTEPLSETSVSSSGAAQAPAPETPSAHPTSQKIKRGTRLSEDWTLPDDLRNWAEGKGMPPDQVSRVEQDFRDYWIAKSGHGANKTDWFATWRRWVRKDLDDNRRSTPSRPQNGGQVDAINAAFEQRAREIMGASE